MVAPPRLLAPRADGARPAYPSYARRRPEATDLYRIVQENLATLYAMSEAGDAPALPKFVRGELDGFLGCGLLSRGFARLACDRCKQTHLVAFSCHGRGICPSCMGRRMAERGANLVDDVMPSAPLRHWVLTMPHPLRAALAYDRALMTRVAGLFAKTLVAHYRRWARDRQGVRGEGGAVLVIQRVSSDLRLNRHDHVAALDGVFVAGQDPAEPARFVPAIALDDEHIADVLQAFVVRLKRLLVKAGRLDEAGQLTERVQAEEHVTLDALGTVAVTGALPAGPELRARRLPDLRAVPSRDRGALCVEQDGFSLHAKTVVAGDDASARESLLKYMLRPPFAARRIRQRPDGLVRIDLKRAFADGTFAIDMDPVSLLVRLAASVPPPRMHTTRYAGVLASHSSLRARVLRVPKHPPPPGKPATHRSRYIPWAQLRRRTFREDVERCPRAGCGGRMKLLALARDRESVRRFLIYLGKPADPPVLAPARGPPWWRSTVLGRRYSPNL